MKRVVLALVLIASPLSALAACYEGHQQQAASCVEGTMWDQQTRACVPIVTG